MKMASLACAVGAVLSGSALADDRSDCLGSKDNLVAIRACSEIIRREPSDAVAYYLRGDALARNNDLGQAIADFSKAIALSPRFSPAYDSRATAYVAKGDYTSAVADVTKAAELSREVKVKPKGTGPAPAVAKATTVPALMVNDTKAGAAPASASEPTKPVSVKPKLDWKSNVFNAAGG